MRACACACRLQAGPAGPQLCAHTAGPRGAWAHTGRTRTRVHARAPRRPSPCVSHARTLHARTWSRAGTLWGALCTAASASAPPAALQLAIRAACNTFKQPELRGWLASQAEGLQELFAGADTASNKVRGTPELG